MAAAASTKITATPTAYGLTATQATTLATLSSAYTAAYNTAVDPVTRTKAKIAAKNAKKLQLVQNLRDLNRFVQATKTVSDEQKIEIGFPVYALPTPINPPTTAPVIKSITTNNRLSKMKIRDLEGERRGRPTGVQGALVMSFVGETPPADITSWRIEGLTTRTDFEITWSPSIPAFSQVWVTAAWYSPRGMAGPMCSPIAVALGGGVSVTTGSMSVAGGESEAA
jgi:hypothetical protein